MEQREYYIYRTCCKIVRNSERTKTLKKSKKKKIYVGFTLSIVIKCEKKLKSVKLIDS